MRIALPSSSCLSSSLAERRSRTSLREKQREKELHVYLVVVVVVMLPSPPPPSIRYVSIQRKANTAFSGRRSDEIGLRAN